MILWFSQCMGYSSHLAPPFTGKMTSLYWIRAPGFNSILRPCLISVGNMTVEIMWFPMLLQCHLHIESGPRWPTACYRSQITCNTTHITFLSHYSHVSYIHAWYVFFISTGKTIPSIMHWVWLTCQFWSWLINEWSHFCHKNEKLCIADKDKID